MTTVLIVKQNHEGAAQHACVIKKALGQAGIDVLDESQMEQADFVVALGGDGTIMHAAKRAALYQKPVLGINSGRVGFLAGLEPDETHLIQKLSQGEYAVDKRMLLKITYHRQGIPCTQYALNEVAITRNGPARIMDITVTEQLHGCELQYRADGLLAATPTGSTAYSLSAGGPVLDPAVQAIVVTPLCPFSLQTRSLVFSDANRLTVQAACLMGGQICLCVDGEEPVDITGEPIIIEKAQDLWVGLIRLKEESFFERYKNKLLDRSPKS